jgi:integrase/recombinase XerC
MGGKVLPVDGSALAPAPDPVSLLLADKRSQATRRAYAADLRDFFGSGRENPPEDQVRAWVAQPAPAIALALAEYKAGLLARGASEATINRRLAAVRSLLKLAHRLGFASTDGRGLVDGERARAYRDTRGVDLKTLKRLVALPGRDSLRGLRDTAILALLCQNALRRAEVCALTVGDFSLPEKRLYILGKGRGSQKEPVTLSQGTADAIAAYLLAAGHSGETTGPLFRNVHRNPAVQGGGLTADGLYYLVGFYGARLGLNGLTPHKLRHSAITAALDATSGDVRKVQKLSRHRDLRTVALYDDARTDHQGEVTRRLAALLE